MSQSAVSVSNASSVLVVSNRFRRRLIIQNPQSNSNSIWLTFGEQDATADANSLEVLPGGSFSLAKLSEKMEFREVRAITDAVAPQDVYVWEE